MLFLFALRSRLPGVDHTSELPRLHHGTVNPLSSDALTSAISCPLAPIWLNLTVHTSLSWDPSPSAEARRHRLLNETPQIFTSSLAALGMSRRLAAHMLKYRRVSRAGTLGAHRLNLHHGSRVQCDHADLATLVLGLEICMRTCLRSLAVPSSRCNNVPDLNEIDDGGQGTLCGNHVQLVRAKQGQCCMQLPLDVLSLEPVHLAHLPPIPQTDMHDSNAPTVWGPSSRARSSIK